MAKQATLGTKEAILNAMKLKSENATISGGEVIIKEVTAEEYQTLFSSETVKDLAGEFDGNVFASILATRCIVDADGNRIFEDTDAPSLRNGSSAEYTKIILTVKKVNGIDLKN